MIQRTNPVRAVGLLSGGLDSTLATAMLLEQGIEVLGLNFSTGFCLTDHRRAMKKDVEPKKVRNEALRCGSDFNVPVEIVDICNQEYLGLLTKPKYGYGAAANPCIDCRSYMFHKAKEYMQEVSAQFVFSGEVLGQRPMSQQLRQMKIIAKESGLEGLLLRPLSAQLLPETIPERERWVNRSELGRVHGRSRQSQFELARRYGLHDFPQPAGGCCYLTDHSFAARFRDFMRFQTEDYIPMYEDFLLLKLGRHFRLPTGTKAMVGRDESENQFLRRFFKGHWVCQTVKEGPTVLSPEPFDGRDTHMIASLAARYSGNKHKDQVAVRCGIEGDWSDEFTVEPAPAELTKTWLI